MIRCLLTGTLYAEPQQRTSQNGKVFTTGKLRADASDGIVLDSQPEPDISADIPSDPAPDISDNPAASPDSAPDIAPGSIEARTAELMAEGWAAANARAVYRSRPTHSRRSRSEIESIKDWLYATLAAENPMTCRQVFYRAVSAGIIGKTEGEYKQTVIRLLTEMRKAQELPWQWLADNTRWQRKPDTSTGLASMLENTARFYRRALWRNQPHYVEIWLEKDALAGVLLEETSSFDVPLMVSRGYSSYSFLASAAETIQGIGKPTYLYYFGDYDPSGINIPQVIERQLRVMAEGAEIHFSREAVTTEQIESLKLPTRPTKRTDSRAKGFEGESVEVDAIHPRTLREMVNRCIVQHIDPTAYNQTIKVEAAERETLQILARAAREGGAVRFGEVQP